MNMNKIAQARSLLLGEYVRVISKSKANVFFNYADKAVSSISNRISINEA
ncbi:MAG TPA: hypothetical protein VLD84_08915 [Nitrososphaeraceae archaeon]|nr:hypothetical protein [Nitrososphaeraceae archaeon]